MQQIFTTITYEPHPLWSWVHVKHGTLRVDDPSKSLWVRVLLQSLNNNNLQLTYYNYAQIFPPTKIISY